VEQLSLVDDEPAPRRISVTALVELRRCPRRYEFAEVEGHGRRAPAGGLLGAAVHRAIQTGRVKDPEVAPYVAAYQAGPFAARRLVASELPIKLRRKGFLITGRIDAVYAGESDDEWELVDWKSGGPPAEPDVADDAQLEVYALAAINDFGRAPEQVITTYAYLATGSTRTRRWSAALVAEAEAALAADLARIETGDYPAWPNRTCGACDALPVCPAGLSSLDPSAPSASSASP
jgi:hypothetical protein